MKPSVTSALNDIYLATDCSNKVYNWCTAQRGKKFFEEAVSLGLAISVNDCLTVDGDGCAIIPERYSKGYRLTLAGYQALTACSPTQFPESERRDWSEEEAEEREWEARKARCREVEVKTGAIGCRVNVAGDVIGDLNGVYTVVQTKAEFEAARRETGGKKETPGERRWIVELEPGVWLGTCEGDPSRTCQVDNANRYVTESLACAALDAARRYRPFTDARIVEVYQ